VREPEEYRGVGDGPMGWSAARGGHIPSAVNLPWRSLLDAEGRVKPREELGKILIPLGIRPDAEIVVYCSGGVRAGHTWFVLHWLGYPSVRNYAGSWWEWALDRSLPTESGGARERPQGPAFPGVGEP
jgi:thiosulfate/3-mercaptopyruvate sulfurtransferase